MDMRGKSGIRNFITLCLWIFAYIDLGSLEKALPSVWTKSGSTVPNAYQCFARCVAKCVFDQGQMERASSLENMCAKKCHQYEKSDLCPPTDSSCWSKCNGLFQNQPTNPSKMPTNVTIGYTRFPQPTPREADLVWKRTADVHVHVVKYADLSDETSQNTPIFKVIIGNNFHFIKPSLCSKYAFAVAAVTSQGIGQFSEAAILDTPKPIVPTPSYVLISAERINEPFMANPDDEYGKEYNTTVVVLIGFSPPSNWDLSTEITRIDAHVHIVDAGTPRLSFFTEPRRVSNLARFEIRLPGAVADTFSYCKFMFTVEKIFTKCDDQNAVMYPSYAYNAGLNQTLPGLSVQINCQDIKNSGCKYNPTAILPSCGFKDVTTDVNHEEGSDTANIDISFVTGHDPYGGRPILWYNITYGEGQKGTNTSESLLYNLTKLISTFKLGNDSNNFTMKNVDVGKVYVVYICTVYDLRSQNIVGDFNELQRYAIDLTNFEHHSPISKSGNSDPRLVTMVLAPLLVFILTVALITTLFLFRKCRAKKLENEYGAEYMDDGDGRYVTLKKRLDHWELPRKRLQVDQNHKLGSGAFGAVYKGEAERGSAESDYSTPSSGRILGTLTKNRDSKSVLAEQWMQSENCEVAVKMLPAYADEISKSEFMSEINLMKQLGYHERLVNMLACITSDDPLCLIVEYCSDGDLLNYLRKRRKYMMDLQDKGVDINNITDSNDIHFNMVLCKKDLISFAWQISVGLEYLSERGYIHRDVAGRNVLVASGKRAKIGDFGLCRYSCSDPVYMSKGGRLPIKWMALEAIKNYEFTTKSDVWSYGVLLFEIVTLGASPYPGIQPHDMEAFLDSGHRMEQPESSPYELYEVMLDCWREDPEKRPTFTNLREGMRLMLEHITEDYYYMGLNHSRDYYNYAYKEDEFLHQPSVDGPQTSRASADHTDHADQSIPPSPTDTISIDDTVLENNVFDPPSPQPANDRATLDQGSTSPTVAPPLPPRLKPRRMNSVGNESITSSDDSYCPSPAFIVRRHDSVSSEQALLSPGIGDKHGFPKFFRFTPSAKLTPLHETPSNTSNAECTKAENEEKQASVSTSNDI